jgi:protein-tyrosine phosphatase
MSDPAQPIQLKGANNFRDAGGFKTQDGWRMRTGLIYRSDSLHALKRGDLKTLERLQIRQVIDLRTPAEQRIQLDRLPAGTAYLHLPIYLAWQNPLELRHALFRGQCRPEQFWNDLKQSYQKIVSAHRAEFTQLFEILGQPERLPILIHCAGGKDRTGMSIALIQTMLGVPRDTVFADYLNTPPRRAQAMRRLSWMIWLFSLSRTSPATLGPLLEPRQAYLAAFFEQIELLYGSVEMYLEQGLGLSPKRLEMLRFNLTEEIA